MMTRDEAIKLLQGGRQGVIEWNRRRKDGEKIPDLRGVHLVHANLGGIKSSNFDPYKDHDLSFIIPGANLSDADLTGAILVDAKFENAAMRRAILGHADLRAADFRHAILDDASLYSSRDHPEPILPNGRFPPGFRPDRRSLRYPGSAIEFRES